MIITNLDWDEVMGTMVTVIVVIGKATSAPPVGGIIQWNN